MERLIVRGKCITGGRITVGGNKNAVLPMIAATLLTDEEVVLENVPDIRDVRSMLDIAASLGAEYTFQGHRLRIRTKNIPSPSIDRVLCSRNRTSVLFAAPLINRTGRAEIYPPGGDVIGRRRLDGHFYGLKTLGADLTYTPTSYIFKTNGRLRGRELFLDECSVTATEQIIMAAVMAEGTTMLLNAAAEPHVCDLADMLNEMGGHISGIGSNTLTIEGVDHLHGVVHEVTGDHIEAGSYLALGAAAGVPVEVTGTALRHHWMLRRVFQRLGLELELRPGAILLPAGQERRIVSDYGGHIPQISDGPWPQYPSDMMSCTIVAATQCAGATLFFEKMFESRIYFVDRLIDMGANAIVCDPHRVLINGPTPLYAQEMNSPDIRAGMAMVIAAICAEGTSTINKADMIYRGYDNLVEKLTSLGADVVAETI
ncbi:MAG: UDP-N-acetylglucosamine 1-carboxyvinyltransferase [Victivallaceae bacterium]|nr:UDP-N-acetylglucosamine 1-carboxyvinyltransferase [Victivallaceae bacterium]